MSPSNSERRYTDEEFALIFRTASEVSGQTESAPVQGGLTLGEIQGIALEVGIDPKRVARAASLLPQTTDATLSRIIGGASRYRLEQTVAADLSPGQLAQVADLARRTLGIQGEAREVLGALEWKGSTATTTLGLSLSPREGGTTIQASCDRTESLLGIYAGAGGAVLGATALVLVKTVFGETDAGIIAGLLSGFPPAFLFARALWKRSSRKWLVRLTELMNALVEEAEGIGKDPPS